MKTRAFWMVAIALALPSQAAEIFRCQARDNTVTYQQLPCDQDALGGAARIPSEFPPVNMAERERLLAREADLYRRLEAQRDRQVHEASLRDAREERALERDRLAAAAAAAEQQYFLVGRPARIWRSPQRYSIR